MPALRTSALQHLLCSWVTVGRGWKDRLEKVSAEALCDPDPSVLKADLPSPSQSVVLLSLSVTGSPALPCSRSWGLWGWGSRVCLDQESQLLPTVTNETLVEGRSGGHRPTVGA